MHALAGALRSGRSAVARALPGQDAARLPDAARRASTARKPALLFKGSTISYAQLEAESTAFAAALVALGVRTGDRVALLLPNCPQFLVAEFGAWKAGAVVVAAQSRPTASASSSRRSTRRGATTVVVLTPFYERGQARAADAPRCGTSSPRRSRSTCRRCCACCSRCSRRRRTATASRCAPATSGSRMLLARASRDRRGRHVAVRPDDRAVILSSGGTTGTPKGRRRPASPLRRGRSAAATSGRSRRRSRGSTSSCCRCRCSTSTATSACSRWRSSVPNPLSLVPNPRDIDDLLKTIKQVKPAFFNGVPTLYTAILNHPDVRAGKVDLQLDQAVLLRRRGTDGRDQAAVRGEDRRAASSRATR